LQQLHIATHLLNLLHFINVCNTLATHLQLTRNSLFLSSKNQHYFTRFHAKNAP